MLVALFLRMRRLSSCSRSTHLLMNRFLSEEFRNNRDEARDSLATALEVKSTVAESRMSKWRYQIPVVSCTGDVSCIRAWLVPLLRTTQDIYSQSRRFYSTKIVALISEMYAKNCFAIMKNEVCVKNDKLCRRKLAFATFGNAQTATA